MKSSQQNVVTAKSGDIPRKPVTLLNAPYALDAVCLIHAGTSPVLPATDVPIVEAIIVLTTSAALLTKKQSSIYLANAAIPLLK